MATFKLTNVASHIFHQTSCAAATTQNYALRNVLGIQPPALSGSVSAWYSAGSSSRVAHGAGPGVQNTVREAVLTKATQCVFAAHIYAPGAKVTVLFFDRST